MNKKTAVSLFFVFIMVVSSFGILATYSPNNSMAKQVLPSNSPSGSISNSASITATLSGDQNFGTINSGHVVLTPDSISYSLSLTNSGSWSQSGDTFTWQESVSPTTYLSGTSTFVAISGAIPYYANGATGYYAVGTIDLYLIANGNSYLFGSYSPSYSYSASSSSTQYWQMWTDQSISGLSSGSYSMSLKVVLTTGNSNTAYHESGGITTDAVATDTYGSTIAPTQGTNSNWITGYTYNGATVSTGSLNIPSNLKAWDIVNTNVPSGVSASASGIQTSGFSSYVLFTGSSSTPLTSTSYTIDYATENAVESETQTFSTTTLTQNPTETSGSNWWNSSFSYQITPSSSWINGSSVDGRTWSTTLTTYSVSNILSAGYGTNAPVDIMEISGSHSVTYNQPSQYESFTVNPSTTENSAFTLSFNVAEFINYQPNTPTITASYSGSGSTVNVQVVTGEQITGEHENILINWGDGQTTPLNNVAFGTQPIKSHTYTGNYQGTFSQSYSPTVTVTNLPNGNPSGNTVQTNSATSSPYTFGLQDTPTTPNSEIVKGQYIWLNVTATNLQPSSASIVVNGLSGGFATLAYQSGNHYDYKYTNSLFGTTGVTVQWTISDSTSISDILTVQYATPLEPNVNSSYVTALFSNSATHSYPVNLTNVPQEGQVPITITNSQSSATGAYQQLINFPTSTYKNSINANFSDVYFTYGNGTTIPSWIQNNASNTYTTTPIWMKLNSIPASSSITVYAHIVPNSDFFGQKWANIGENGYLSSVYNANNNIQDLGFAYFQDFAGNTLPSDWNTNNATTTTVNNGLKVYGEKSGFTNIGSNVVVNASTQTTYFTGYASASSVNFGDQTFYLYYPDIGITMDTNGQYATYNNNGGLTGVDFSGGKIGSLNNFYIYRNQTGSLGGIVGGSGSYNPTDFPSTKYTFNIGMQIDLSTSYLYLQSVFVANGTYGSMPSAIVSTTMQSSNGTQQYYQQEITISNSTTGHSPSYYGLNSANSNFQITTSSGSPLYTWIQSGNQSSLTFWTKTPYSASGTETLQMQVFPSFENLFSANGYLGYEREYFNAKYVFPFASDMSTLDGFTINSGANYVLNSNGLQLYSNVGGNLLATNITYNTNTTRIIANMSFNPHYVSTPTFYPVITSLGYLVGNNPSLDVFNGSANPQIAEYGQTAVATNYPFYTNETFSVWHSSTALYSSMNGGNIYSTGFSWTGNGQLGIWANQVSSPTYVFINYFIATNDPSTMPTASISGSGQVYQSNSSNYNTTYQHYATFNPDQYNLSAGEYTYSIPDSFDSNYVTIYYNPAWTLEYASYGNSPGKEYFSNGSYMPFITFSGVSGIGTITMTFIEPITIGQPLGTMSLGVLPSVAIGGKTFFEMPANYLHWEEIDQGTTQPINPSGFSVIVGKPVTIIGYTGANTPVYNKTITPDQYNTFLQTYVNVSSIEIMNENMNETLHIQATSNGTTQAVADVLPFQTQTIYVPGTDYTVSLTRYNFTTGQPIGNTQTITTFGQTGLQWWIAKGIMLSQIQNNINFTRTGVANEINDLKISINLNDSAIKNITTDINVNLSGTNASIQNQITKIFTNFTYQNSLINNENLSIADSIDLTQSMIKSFNLNLSDNFTIVNSYIKNLNLSQKSRFAILQSSIGNLSFNQNDYFNLTKDAIHNLNLNLSENFTLTNDIINNLNLSSASRFTILQSNIGNMSFNVTQYYTLEQDSIKNLNLNLSDNFTLTNDIINNANISQYNRFEILNSTIKNLNYSEASYFTLLNSSVKNLSLSDKQYFKIVNSSINNFNLSLATKISLVNDSIHNLNLSEITRFQIVNSAISNLNLSQTSYFKIVNDSIHSLNLSDYQYFNLVNDSIHNLNLSLVSKISLINSTITNLNITEKTRFDIINSSITDLNLSQTQYFDIMNSTVHNLNLTQTQYFQIMHSVVTNMNINQSQRYKIEEEAGAYAYHFVPKTSTLLANGVDITAWLENNANSPVDNKSLVYSVWKNITIAYLNLTSNYAVKPQLISYNNYSVTFFLPLNKSEIANLTAGTANAEVSLYSPFNIGAISNIATGSINPSNTQFGNVSGILGTLGFTVAPPYGSGFAGMLIWFFSQNAGRAITEMVVMTAALLELFMYWKGRGKRSNVLGNKKLQLQIEEMHNKIMED